MDREQGDQCICAVGMKEEEVEVKVIEWERCRKLVARIRRVREADAADTTLRDRTRYADAISNAE